MGQSLRAAAIFGVALLLLILFAGCGGGSSSSTSDPTEPAAESSKQFNDPEGASGKEPVATFGEEAAASVRGEASSVLAENLTARQAADFETQCATLGKRGLEAVLGAGKKAADPSKCAETLKKLAEPLSGSKKARADDLGGEIAALRIKADQAYALYHGTDGKDWAMPMELESGNWRVGGILAIELPKTKAKSQSKPKAEKKKEA